MQFLVILALAIALVAVLFAVQNPGFVAINFFGWAIQERLALILLLTLAAGVLVGLLVSIPALIRRNMRISSHRREIEKLKWQFQEQEAQLSTHSQEKVTIQQQQRELLTAIGTTDSRTGLLREEFVAPTLSYLLKRMMDNVSNPRYNSVAVFLVEPVPVDPAVTDPAIVARSLQAVTHRIEQAVTPNSWLYYDGAGRFTCLTSGLDTKTASDYGETLRVALSDQPLDLGNGVKQPINVSVGGALTFPTTFLESQTLLQQAEEALEYAKKRGRNRFRLVEVKG